MAAALFDFVSEWECICFEAACEKDCAGSFFSLAAETEMLDNEAVGVCFLSAVSAVVGLTGGVIVTGSAERSVLLCVVGSDCAGCVMLFLYVRMTTSAAALVPPSAAVFSMSGFKSDSGIVRNAFKVVVSYCSVSIFCCCRSTLTLCAAKCFDTHCSVLASFELISCCEIPVASISATPLNHFAECFQ